jgi:hypothetical protein
MVVVLIMHLSRGRLQTQDDLSLMVQVADE